MSDTVNLDRIGGVRQTGVDLAAALENQRQLLARMAVTQMTLMANLQQQSNGFVPLPEIPAFLGGF